MKNVWDPDVYAEAWSFATQAHEGQMYGGVPYINHIGSVAMELTLALGKSQKDVDANFVIQCALLHDVLEDTSVTYEELVDRFGGVVADGVQALTKNPEVGNKSVQMEDSLERILQQPVEVAMVKLADRIVNLYSPPSYWSLKKKKSYRKEALMIYRVLMGADTYLAARLMEKIEQYGV